MDLIDETHTNRDTLEKSNNKKNEIYTKCGDILCSKLFKIYLRCTICYELFKNSQIFIKHIFNKHTVTAFQQYHNNPGHFDIEFDSDYELKNPIYSIENLHTKYGEVSIFDNASSSLCYYCDFCSEVFTEFEIFATHTNCTDEPSILSEEECPDEAPVLLPETDTIDEDDNISFQQILDATRIFLSVGAANSLVDVKTELPPISTNIQSVDQKAVVEIKAEIIEQNEEIPIDKFKYKCKFCEKQYTGASALTEHARIHRGDPTVTCEFCNRDFLRTNYLTEHQKIFHTAGSEHILPDISHIETVNTLVCEFCKKTFIKSENLIDHLKIHYGCIPYQCKICNLKFIPKRLMLRHVRQMHEPRVTKASMARDLAMLANTVNNSATNQMQLTAKIKTKTKIKIKIIKQQINTKHICSECGREYGTERKLKFHRRSHEYGDKFKCEICGNFFKNFLALDNHEKRYTGERKFKCNLCPRKYLTETTKILHEETLACLKFKYLCKICNVKFESQSDLDIHLNQHKINEVVEDDIAIAPPSAPNDNNGDDDDGEGDNQMKNRTNKYKYCNTKFEAELIQYPNLHGNRLRGKPIKTFSFCVCKMCNISFKSKRSFKYHMRLHRLGNKYQCKICDKLSATAYSLKRHMKSHTKQNAEKHLPNIVDNNNMNVDFEDEIIEKFIVSPQLKLNGCIKEEPVTDMIKLENNMILDDVEDMLNCHIVQKAESTGAISKIPDYDYKSDNLPCDEFIEMTPPNIVDDKLNVWACEEFNEMMPPNIVDCQSDLLPCQDFNAPNIFDYKSNILPYKESEDMILPDIIDNESNILPCEESNEMKPPDISEGKSNILPYKEYEEISPPDIIDNDSNNLSCEESSEESNEMKPPDISEVKSNILPCKEYEEIKPPDIVDYKSNVLPFQEFDDTKPPDITDNKSNILPFRESNEMRRPQIADSKSKSLPLESNAIKQLQSKITRNALHSIIINQTSIPKLIIKRSVLPARLNAMIPIKTAIYICKFCDRKFSKLSSLDNHTFVHTNAKLFKCSDCPASFCLEQTKISHEKRHAARRNYIVKSQKSIVKRKPEFPCQYCEKTYELEAELIRHTATHYRKHGIYQIKSIYNLACPKCPKRFKNEKVLNLHKEVHKKVVKKLTCKYCKQQFEDKKLLSDHNKIHQKFKCSYCPAQFSLLLTKNCHERFKHNKGGKLIKSPSTLTNYNSKAGRRKQLQKNIFKCDKCPKTFSSPIILKGHMRIHIKIIKIEKIQCHFCPLEFENHNEMELHEISHSVSTDIQQQEQEIHQKFKCEQCQKVFKTMKILEIHVKRHENRIYRCTMCLDFFKDSLSLRKHKLTHMYSEKPFKCEICKLQFMLKSSLDKHINKKHPNNDPIIPVELVPIQKTEIGITNEPTVEKRFQCTECQIFVQSAAKLRSHMHTHKINPFRCPICPTHFKTAERLEEHKKLHDEANTGAGKARKCKLCGGVFRSGSILKNHYKVHSNNRPFGCGHCPDRFKSKASLIAHERKHTGERPFKCHYCDLYFARTAYRTKHELKTHK